MEVQLSQVEWLKSIDLGACSQGTLQPYAELLSKILIIAAPLLLPVQLLLDPFALAHALKLDEEGVLQALTRHLHESVVGFYELQLHPVEVSDRQQEQLGRLLSHDCELPDKPIPLLDPVLASGFVPEDAADDVFSSEIAPIGDADVLGVVVLGQHVAASAFLLEEDVDDLVPFEVDVGLLLHEIGLQERADPGYQRHRLVLHEVDVLVRLLVDVQRDLDLQVVWQLIHEDVEAVDFLAEAVLQTLLQPLIQLHWKSVVLVDLVQDIDLLCELCVLGIVVLDDRGQRSTCEGECNDSDDHNEDTEDPLQLSLVS